MNNLKKQLADIEAIVKNEKPSKNIIISGYRPAFKVKEDYLTTGEIKFKTCNEIKFGEQAIAEIRFITPEFYPSSLEIGQIIPFQEGGIINGYATIIKIYNKILEK